MSDYQFLYCGDKSPSDLALGECSIRKTIGAPGGVEFWNLWFRVPRDTDAHPETFRVPVRVGVPGEGPGGHTWGLSVEDPTKSTRVWSVSPSIDAGAWHHTTRIVAVPAGEPWQSETQ